MPLFSYRKKRLLLKIISFFSVIRGYNILLIIVAQYLAAIFILAPHLPVLKVLLDPELFVIVLVSALCIAAGYIINNFYDAEKDLINRPNKTFLDSYVSRTTRISVYFVLNFLAVILSAYISFRAVLFFSAYIFFMWFYSHKLKKYPFIGNITASALVIVPFFAVFIYYGNFNLVVFVHATLLFLLLSIRELANDLENLAGDLTLGYHTIPVAYGERFAKVMLTFLCLFTLIPIGILLYRFEVGYMRYYLMGCVPLLLFFITWLWKSRKKSHYVLLHNLIKLIILAGVVSLAFIDVGYLSS